MTTPTEALLAERGATHGNYADHAQITQDLKVIITSTPGYQRLTAAQRETLDMTAHKIGRILAGDPNFKDHWDDIAGYNILVAKML